MSSAASVNIFPPVTGAELRDARLRGFGFAIHGGTLRVLHAAEHHSVERGGSPQEEITLGLAERAKRAEHKRRFETLHAVKRASSLRKNVGLCGGKIAHNVDTIGQTFCGAFRDSPRNERLATALGTDVLLPPVLFELCGVVKELVSFPCNIILAENIYRKGIKKISQQKQYERDQEKNLHTITYPRLHSEASDFSRWLENKTVHCVWMILVKGCKRMCVTE